MPSLYQYICDRCSFNFPGGWGCDMYAQDDAGIRWGCRHPLECLEIRKIFRNDAPEELIQARTGITTYSVCLACITQFDLDIGGDPI